MTRTSAFRPVQVVAGGIAAVSISLTGLGVAAPAVAADQPIVAAAQKAEIVMNYAVNLVSGASAAQFEAAASLAGKHGKVLAKYPQIDTFFVQSAAKDFSEQYAKEISAKGIGLHSVGPTRTKPVEGKELLVHASSADRSNRSAYYSAGVENQLNKERNLGSDPDTAKAWGIAATGADEAAKVDVKLAPVTVGVIDSGVEGNHEDLKGQIDPSKSVGCDVNGIADNSYAAWQPDDTEGSDHGTHVAGTIAAATNGIGVEGVAPKARLAAVKAGNRDGYFYPEYVACGFMWAAKQGFDVTNNSYYVDPWEYWMPTEGNQAAGLEAVRRAVEFASSQGVLNISAAGNSDQDLDNVSTDSSSPNDNGDENIIENRPVAGGVDIPTMLPGVVRVSAVGLAPEPGRQRVDLKQVEIEESRFF